MTTINTDTQYLNVLPSDNDLANDINKSKSLQKGDCKNKNPWITGQWEISCDEKSIINNVSRKKSTISRTYKGGKKNQLGRKLHHSDTIEIDSMMDTRSTSSDDNAYGSDGESPILENYQRVKKGLAAEVIFKPVSQDDITTEVSPIIEYKKTTAFEVEKDTQILEESPKKSFIKDENFVVIPKEQNRRKNTTDFDTEDEDFQVEKKIAKNKRAKNSKHPNHLLEKVENDLKNLEEKLAPLKQLHKLNNANCYAVSPIKQKTTKKTIKKKTSPKISDSLFSLKDSMEYNLMVEVREDAKKEEEIFVNYDLWIELPSHDTWNDPAHYEIIKTKKVIKPPKEKKKPALNPKPFQYTRHYELSSDEDYSSSEESEYEEEFEILFSLKWTDLPEKFMKCF